MRHRVLLCVVMTFTLSAGAQAPSAPQSASEAEARRLMEAMGMRKMMDTMLPQIFEQMRTRMEASFPQTEAGARAREVSNFIQQRTIEEMKKWDIEGLTVRVYAKHFSAEEIRALVQFYESPIGKKLLEKTPTIMQESMAESMQRSQEIMQKIMREVREKFPELKDVPIPPQ